MALTQAGLESELPGMYPVNIAFVAYCHAELELVNWTGD